MVPCDASADRRRFLKLLAASPLLSVAGLSPGNGFAQFPPGGVDATDSDAGTGVVVGDLKEVLNVFDLQKTAEKTMLYQHYMWLASGVEDESTLRANREGFNRYQIRARVLADTSKMDTSLQVFGTKWSMPLIMSPCSRHGHCHPDGELGSARAAQKADVKLCVATDSSFSIEEVNKARGEPNWWQLYVRSTWVDTLNLIKRVEAAGCPVLVWTVDLMGGSNRELSNRAQGKYGPSIATRIKYPECAACHERRELPMSAPATKGEPTISTWTWNDVKRLRDASKMKFLIKGIQTREDAEQAIAVGVDGIWVSNHGGRGPATLRATIESLPEIAAGVKGRVPIIMDSGIRRGTDIFKALALGATAIGVGRAFLFGLGAFGEAGAQAAIDILRRELLMIMRQAGTNSLAQIKPSCLVDRLAPRS
jgi:4-hydroxymandelate oxidase